MRHTVHNFFTIGGYEKEEKWLNSMSAKGLQLVSTNGIRYVFEEGGRGEYVYRLELLEHLPSHPESVMYLRFLEETGVEHVSSFHRWVYLRKKAGAGAFEVYSDIDSKLAHHRRILNISLGVSVALLINTAVQILCAGIEFSARHALPGWSNAYIAPFFIAAGVSLVMLAVVQIIAAPLRSARKKLLLQKQISE